MVIIECLNCKKEISRGKFCSNQCQADYNWEIKKNQIRTNGIESLSPKEVHNTQTYELKDRCQKNRNLKALIIDDNPHGETGRACWHCGWEEENPFTKKRVKGRRANGLYDNRFVSNIPTQLNHIDGNPFNNKLDNLEIVCPNCHSLGEYYGSRGKGARGKKDR